MQALVQKSAMIIMLCFLAAFFLSGCGQRGALYLPGALTSTPPGPSLRLQKEQTDGTLSGVPERQSNAASPLPQTVNYSPGVPTVNVMEAPVFFELPIIHFPIPANTSSPSPSSLNAD